MVLKFFLRHALIGLWLINIPALASSDSGAPEGQGRIQYWEDQGTQRLQKVRGLGQLTNKDEHHFDQIYVFGDSLSDTEAVYTKSGGAFPRWPFYWRGRFSNGPAWDDYFSESVQIPMKSFAHAGARILGKNNFYVIPPLLMSLWVDPITKQVDEFKKFKSHFNSSDLIMIWAGSNDYLLFPSHNSVEENISALISLIRSLQQLGGERFVIINVPDVSRSPFHALGIGRIIMDQKSINRLVMDHNKELKSTIDALNNDASGLDVALVDMYSAFTDILDHREDFGFNNTDYPCIGGQLIPGGFSYVPFDFNAIPQVICPNSDQLFFWDPWHPSTRAHCLASASLLTALADQGWVEGYNQENGIKACI